MSDPEVISVGRNGVVEVVYIASKQMGGKRIELGSYDTYEEAEVAILQDEAATPPHTTRCPDCEGTGHRSGDECNMCAGTGRVPKR